jgi:peptidoglycan/xylan/chitin deacetylase (PgdA/CDA1 family)
MYHELGMAGRPLCRAEEGYARYCISDATFRAQLAWLRSNGYQGRNVSQALDAGPHATANVAITFDDGCETDLLAAAPSIHEVGFSATFFVVSTWIGRPGHLSSRQLRELLAGGFEIGAHSRTHAYLPDLAFAALRSEVAQSKDEIEQMLGGPVKHFSCPGGRWSPAVRLAAKDAGFRTVSTSRPGLVTSGSGRFRLPRTAILDGMSLRDFAALCRGEGQWVLKTRSQLLEGAKRLMGNRLYEQVRAAVLKPRAAPESTSTPHS